MLYSWTLQPACFKQCFVPWQQPGNSAMLWLLWRTFFILCREVNKCTRYMNCHLSAPWETATSILTHFSNCHKYTHFTHPGLSSPFQRTANPLLVSTGKHICIGKKSKRGVEILILKNSNLCKKITTHKKLSR